MALTHNDFKTYPLQIVGISAEYDSQITAIEAFVREEIAYTGTASDIADVVSYFVFYHFCEDKASEVNAKTGETSQIAEFTVPSVLSQVTAWNLGASKLLAICNEKVKEANPIYTSRREWI